LQQSTNFYTANVQAHLSELWEHSPPRHANRPQPLSWVGLQRLDNFIMEGDDIFQSAKQQKQLEGTHSGHVRGCAFLSTLP